MRTMLSVMMGAITAVATSFYVYWLPGPQSLRGVEPRWLRSVASLFCAAIAAAFVIHRIRVGPQGRIEAVALGVLAVGATGFVLGFFGPILLAPGANQGRCLACSLRGHSACCVAPWPAGCTGTSGNSLAVQRKAVHGSLPPASEARLGSGRCALGFY